MIQSVFFSRKQSLYFHFIEKKNYKFSLAPKFMTLLLYIMEKDNIIGRSGEIKDCMSYDKSSDTPLQEGISPSLAYEE